MPLYYLKPICPFSSNLRHQLELFTWIAAHWIFSLLQTILCNSKDGQQFLKYSGQSVWHQQLCHIPAVPEVHFFPCPNGQLELQQVMLTMCRCLNANNVGQVDNWHTYWGRPGQTRREDLTVEGTAVLSSHLARFIYSPKCWQSRVQPRRQSCGPELFSELLLEQSPSLNTISTVSAPRPSKLIRSTFNYGKVVTPPLQCDSS